MTNDSGKKPREFWILPQKGGDCEWTNLYPDESWKSETKPLIHVREITPCANCERLEAKYQEKNDDFRATFLKCLKDQEEIQRLQKQVESYEHTLSCIIDYVSDGKFSKLSDHYSMLNLVKCEFEEKISKELAKLEKE